MAAEGSIKDDVTPPAEEEHKEKEGEEVITLDFDEETLTAIVEVYLNEGDDFDIKGDFLNAIYFYTEGIKVKCGNKKLKATLYSHRATAHFVLGNYQDSLSDATAATQVQPTYLEAIVRGAIACLELNEPEEALRWCVKGLAIERNHSLEHLIHMSLEECFKSGNTKTIIEIINQDLHSAKELVDRADEEFVYNILGYAYQKLDAFSQAIECHGQGLSIAKELGNRVGQLRAYNNLGSAYHKVGDFNQAIEYHRRELSIAKELGDRADEGEAYHNLGSAYHEMGDFSQAIEYHKRHLNIAKELQHRSCERNAYNKIGLAYHELGDFNQAKEYQRQYLNIAKELGDRAGEGMVYNHLGSAYYNLGAFNQAIEYHRQHLSIAKELGDRAGEETAYNNLGWGYYKLGNSNQAIEYLRQALSIAQELGDKASEGSFSHFLSKVYHELGDFNQAVQYAVQYLSISKELGEKPGEESAYMHLGRAYFEQSDFNQTIESHRQQLSIAEELGNWAAEVYIYLGCAYCELGDCNQAIRYAEQCLCVAGKLSERSPVLRVLGLSHMKMGKFFQAVQSFQEFLDIAKHEGNKEEEADAYSLIGTVCAERDDFNQATEYLEKALTIAKDLRNQAIEAQAYEGLAVVFRRKRDFERAIEYLKKCLAIGQERGKKLNVGASLNNMGFIYESSGELHKAVDYYQRSIKLYDELRVLQAEDALKITFRGARQVTYHSLWRTLLKLSKIDEALCAADQGRAQALVDLIKVRYGSEMLASGTVEAKSWISEMTSDVSGQKLFIALEGNTVNLWVIGKDSNIKFAQKEVRYLLGDATAYLKILRKKAYEEVRRRFRVICENRTLDETRTEEELPPAEKRGEEKDNPSQSDENPLRVLHECIISPITNFIEDGELVIVPDGPLWLAPFAAFLDSESKYLRESIRIRFLPSLMCMKLIDASPEDYHNKSGALLVGDPCMKEFTTLLGKNRFSSLPSAKKEVEMIGEMLGIQPLTGKDATKPEVLKRIGLVAVVHIAAHGDIKTGEIALAPNPVRKYRTPEEQDYMLTISDVKAAKLRAKLVVLSCCHSAQGEVSSEGVVGIARAFLGAGARSVLVALWAIDDEATMEFMRNFYKHLRDGNSASESLNGAMKCLRESEKFHAPRFWAPFMLIGDDVTIDIGEINKELSQEEQVSPADVKAQDEFEQISRREQVSPTEVKAQDGT